MPLLPSAALNPCLPALIALDETRRVVVQTLQDMQSRRNAASKEIGAAMAPEEWRMADRLKAEVAELKTCHAGRRGGRAPG